MELKGFLPSLRQVLGVVETLAPLAKVAGVPALSNLADLAATGAAIGRNILTRVEETETVMGDADQKEAKSIIDKLAAINDDLAEKIAES